MIHTGADVVPNGAERTVSDQPSEELWASMADLSVASSSGLRLGSRRSKSAFKVLRGQWAGSGTPLGNISARLEYSRPYDLDRVQPYAVPRLPQSAAL